MSSQLQPSASDALIRIRGLSTVLGGKTIFAGVDLDIPRGGITAVMGPSGTGKTTLMRHITGQLAPDAGEIVVDGKNIARIGREALFALREKIGYLFQNSALLTDFSVFENVAFPLRQHLRLPEELVRNIVLTKLQAVGLRGAAELDAERTVRRHDAARRAGARDRARSDADHLRRTLRRPRSDRAQPDSEIDPHAESDSGHHQHSGGARARRGAPGGRSDLSARRRQDRRAWHVRKNSRRGETPWTRQFFTGEADGPVPFHYPAPDYATQLGLAGERGMSAVRNSPSRFAEGMAQVGACGIFLFRILARDSAQLCCISARDVRQIWFVGAMSLTIIMICGLFVGMVLGLQLYYVLSIFGGTAALGTVVSLSLYRELGPVVTALLFAGRAGTSITAEIGLMRATDQLDAMEMMAVDPLAYVVAPRFHRRRDRDAAARLRVQRARHLRRAPGRRELARPGQRHVLVEHDLERRRVERRGQRRVEKRRVRRGRAR